jgi:hypothetical protein
MAAGVLELIVEAIVAFVEWLPFERRRRRDKPDPRNFPPPR